MKNHERIEAKKLRAKGKSIREISNILNVSVGSVSVWVRDVELSEKAKNVLKEKKIAGQRKSGTVLKKRTMMRMMEAEKFARSIVTKSGLTKREKLVLLGIYYWCEGNKSPKDVVVFTNSDPYVIKAFIHLLRKSFEIDESRFRVSLHLHSYHNVDKELLFWSKTTTIPLSQFFKPYKKGNTGKRKREGYRGCAQVKYYDIEVARMLLALGRLLTEKFGSIS